MATPLDQIRLLRQGQPDFTVGPKLQTIWGAREAFVFSLEGVAATTMVICAAARWLPGMIAAEMAMVGAVALLFSHLGNPGAAWRAIFNLRRSWISRGTAVIGAFCGLGALAILGQFIAVPAFLPDAMFWLLSASAGFIVFYPGFAMAASAGIPFWRTGLLPILSALGGLSSGGAVGLAVAPNVGIDGATLRLAELLVFALIVAAVATMTAIAYRRPGASQVSARLMLNEKRWFWALAVGAGLVLPLILVIAGGNAAWFALAALLRFLGDVAFRYTVLKVGTYEPLL